MTDTAIAVNALNVGSFTEAEMLALARTGVLPSSSLSPEASKKALHGEPGEGGISRDVTKRIASPITFGQYVGIEFLRVMPLLLGEADPSTKTDEARDFWFLIDDDFRGDFLRWCYQRRDEIGARPFSKVLAWTWTRPKRGSLMTAWGFERSLVMKMFEVAEPEHLMEAEEFAIFTNLPSEITVYRGSAGVSVGKVKHGMSWTLDRETAHWFARRYDFKCEPMCLKATVCRRDVFAFFGLPDKHGKGEKEIVGRPGRVHNVELIPVPEEQPSNMGEELPVSDSELIAA